MRPDQQRIERNHYERLYADSRGLPARQVVATPGAIEALAQANIDGRELLSKHHLGEWGDLSESDKRENEFSVDKELRIFSSYRISDDEKVWIITVRHEARKWNERTVETSISSSAACPSIATSRWGEA
jgi:hypothetical protein